MSLKSFFQSITKPIEYIWGKVVGIEKRVVLIIQEAKTFTPEFLTALKTVIAAGKNVFNTVTAAAVTAGSNWTQDAAAVAAVESFVSAFKDFSVVVTKEFEALDLDVKSNIADAPVATPVSTTTEPSTQTVDAPTTSAETVKVPASVGVLGSGQAFVGTNAGRDEHTIGEATMPVDVRAGVTSAQVEKANELASEAQAENAAKQTAENVAAIDQAEVNESAAADTLK